MLGEVEYDEHGLAHDKTSDMAVALLQGQDGRNALLAFTSTESLARWSPEARPMPAQSQLVATAAIQEGAAAIVLDVAGPAAGVLETDDVRRLAAGLQVVRLEDGTYAWIESPTGELRASIGLERIAMRAVTAAVGSTCSRTTAIQPSGAVQQRALAGPGRAHHRGERALCEAVGDTVSAVTEPGPVPYARMGVMTEDRGGLPPGLALSWGVQPVQRRGPEAGVLGGNRSWTPGSSSAIGTDSRRSHCSGSRRTSASPRTRCTATSGPRTS